MGSTRGNLYLNTEAPLEGERFETVALIGKTRVERIVSSSTPSLEPYDQAGAEWVVLLAGEAELEVAGEPLALKAGDHLFLPAHTVHRLLRVSSGAQWLAIHELTD
jgi:cupin 2 domain-containing protein